MGRLNLQQKRRANEAVKCSVDACPKMRTGLGLYCSKHLSLVTFNGSPVQYALTRSDLDPYKRSLIRLIQHNRHHPALQDCTNLIMRWLEDFSQRAAAREDRPLTTWQHELDKEVWRLKQQDTSPWLIFIEVAAVHFLSLDHPDRLAPMTRQYKYALGKAMLLAKGHRAQYGCPGSRIRGKVVFNMGESCSVAFRRVFEAMAEPFKAFHPNAYQRSEPLRPSDIERAIGTPGRRIRNNTKETPND